jgi:hypothetical protein
MLVLVTLMVGPLAAACELKYSPADSMKLIRPEGWQLPGVMGASPAKAEPYHAPDLPGVEVTVLRDRKSFIAQFPEQLFLLDGARQHLQPFLAKATVLRFQVQGKTFAYGYSLIPVRAHKKNGRWIVDGEQKCIFGITFIDDRGDGVFRVLARNWLTPELIPEWVQRLQHA